MYADPVVMFMTLQKKGQNSANYPQIGFALYAAPIRINFLKRNSKHSPGKTLFSP